VDAQGQAVAFLRGVAGHGGVVVGQVGQDHAEGAAVAGGVGPRLGLEQGCLRLVVAPQAAEGDAHRVQAAGLQPAVIGRVGALQQGQRLLVAVELDQAQGVIHPAVPHQRRVASPHCVVVSGCCRRHAAGRLQHPLVEAGLADADLRPEGGAVLPGSQLFQQAQRPDLFGASGAEVVECFQLQQDLAAPLGLGGRRQLQRALQVGAGVGPGVLGGGAHPGQVSVVPLALRDFGSPPVVGQQRVVRGQVAPVLALIPQRGGPVQLPPLAEGQGAVGQLAGDGVLESVDGVVLQVFHQVEIQVVQRVQVDAQFAIAQAQGLDGT